MACRRGDGVPADASPGPDAIDATLHTNTARKARIHAEISISPVDVPTGLTGRCSTRRTNSKKEEKEVQEEAPELEEQQHRPVRQRVDDGGQRDQGSCREDEGKFAESRDHSRDVVRAAAAEALGQGPARRRLRAAPEGDAQGAVRRHQEGRRARGVPYGAFIRCDSYHVVGGFFFEFEVRAGKRSEPKGLRV